MIHKSDVVKLKVKSCALQKPCYNLNLPFDLVFIEFCFNCWCFDFQDCNFLTSRFIIGDGLSSFRTVLSFLSMTSRFPFIFVFWKCVTSYRSNADDTIFFGSVWSLRSHNLRSFICSVQVCLELSIFIFLTHFQGGEIFWEIIGHKF